MIEFVTLLLGLVTGSQAVELSVSEQVALVEVRLDGRFAGGLTGKPWIVDCDFGEQLSPHVLEATAYDGKREELQTVRQWVNLPRDRLEARLALDRRADGRATARLIWAALDEQGPPIVKLRFDGQPLPATDLRAIELPAHDARGLHFLRAEVQISTAERAHAELVFGGSYGEDVSTELTAVVFAAGKRQLRPEKMIGWLRRETEQLGVVAVDRGPVNLLVVRERSEATHSGLKEVYKGYQKELADPGHVSMRMPAKAPSLPPSVLEDGDRVRFAFPTTGHGRVRVVGQGAAPIAVEQVPVSRDVAARGLLFDLLTHSFWSEDESPAAAHQLADAVAVAGVVAAAGDRRRAVVLIRSGAAEDTSRFSPAVVREYLRRLGVPLFVWSIPAQDGAPPAAWGEERDVSTYKRMRGALGDLRKALQSQIVVWVEGSYLSHEIELTEKAAGLKEVS